MRDFNVVAETLQANELAKVEAMRDFLPPGSERLPWACPSCGESNTMWVDQRGERVRCVSGDCLYERDEIEYQTVWKRAILGASDGQSVVYYIRFGPYLKIGVSKTLRTRLPALPHDELRAIEFGTRSLERRRHLEFGHARHSGEWFRLEPELVEHVEQLRADYGREAAAA